MHATLERVTKRENRLHPMLVAVESKVEAWARQSTNGALVWEVATDHVPAMWSEWELIYDRDVWYGGSGLIAALDRLAAVTNDAQVAEAVSAAKNGVIAYSE